MASTPPKFCVKSLKVDVINIFHRFDILTLKLNLWLFDRLVRECVANNQQSQLRRILKVLGDDLALSHNPNSRKGGVIGLAATAIALGKVNVG